MLPEKLVVYNAEPTDHAASHAQDYLLNGTEQSLDTLKNFSTEATSEVLGSCALSEALHELSIAHCTTAEPEDYALFLTRFFAARDNCALELPTLPKVNIDDSRTSHLADLIDDFIQGDAQTIPRNPVEYFKVVPVNYETLLKVYSSDALLLFAKHIIEASDGEEGEEDLVIRVLRFAAVIRSLQGEKDKLECRESPASRLRRSKEKEYDLFEELEDKYFGFRG